MSVIRGWARWCLNHQCKWFVKLVCYLMLPLYLAVYWKDAVQDWSKDIKYINDWRKQ